MTTRQWAIATAVVLIGYPVTATRSLRHARQCLAGESVSGSSANETSRGGVTPYSSFGVHCNAVHNACKVSVFIWTGSLFISAYTDGADKVKLARRARSSRSSLPVHTSREAITCLSRHRSCTARHAFPRLPVSGAPPGCRSPPSLPDEHRDSGGPPGVFEPL
jgi:hypothetical protein